MFIIILRFYIDNILFNFNIMSKRQEEEMRKIREERKRKRRKAEAGRKRREEVED